MENDGSFITRNVDLVFLGITKLIIGYSWSILNFMSRP